MLMPAEESEIDELIMEPFKLNCRATEIPWCKDSELGEYGVSADVKL